MSSNKNSKTAIRLPLYIAIAICIGVFIGANMAGSSNTNSSNIMKNMIKFKQVLTYIENDYVDEVDSDKLVETAISKMLEGS